MDGSSGGGWLRKELLTEPTKKNCLMCQIVVTLAAMFPHMKDICENGSMNWCLRKKKGRRKRDYSIQSTSEPFRASKSFCWALQLILMSQGCKRMYKFTLLELFGAVIG